MSWRLAIELKPLYFEATSFSPEYFRSLLQEVLHTCTTVGIYGPTGYFRTPELILVNLQCTEYEYKILVKESTVYLKVMIQNQSKLNQ